jgi:SAM-dependent methyltransferase
VAPGRPSRDITGWLTHDVGVISGIDRPAYHDFTGMDLGRRRFLADSSSRQVIATCEAWLSKPWSQVDALDLGCGYGDTAAALAVVCRSVVGIEPARDLVETAQRDHPEVTFRRGGVEEVHEEGAFDLVVLDNVYEHLPDHDLALHRIARALRPGGVLYVLVPNRAWPIEAHYRLPFLGWLPLPLANAYLRRSGRGSDFSDASHAPTWWSLRRELRAHPALEWRFALPGDPTATRSGLPAHYRMGIRALRAVPPLWAISKAFLVVAVKRPEPECD